MFDIQALLTVADEYSRLTGVGEKTVSSRVFADSKKLAALRGGADITTSRFNAAWQWFSDNWPGGEPWPEGIERPINVKLFDAMTSEASG